MARSILTIAELKVQAQLLGGNWYYDPKDHSFNTPYDYVDADTFENLLRPLVDSSDIILNRYTLVRRGKIGAADYDPRND